MLCLSLGWAVGQVPPEVTGLRFTNAGTLAWDPMPGATAYSVYRGTRGEGTDLGCLVFRTADTTAGVPDLPGTLFTYVVSAWNEAGEGSLGTTSGGSDRLAAVPCVDGEGDGVFDALDNCALVSNPDQADQNQDGRGDLCDPLTYHFETDPLGARPAEVTATGAVNATFTVRASLGDRAVAYDAGTLGAADAFDRLVLAGERQDQVIWIDTHDAAGEYLDLLLWNDGSHAENAGGAILFRIDAAGGLAAYHRGGNGYVLLGTSAAGGAGRLRLRLQSWPGNAARLRVDTWDGTQFVPDAAQFDLADAHTLFGRGLALTDIAPSRRPLLRLSAEGVDPAADFLVLRRIDLVQDWKLFQRGPDDTAAIPVEVFARSPEPVRLELALFETATGTVLPGFDFADHPLDLGAVPAGRFARAELAAVPAGGNYDLVARLVETGSGFVRAEERVNHLAVGDVFLAAGQSNMSGYSGTLDNAEAPVDNVHLFGNDYRWKRAREPMDDGTDQVDRVSGESPAHSLMLRFAKDVSAAIGVPVAIIPAPLGGTNLHTQWQRRADDPDHRGTLYGSAIHRVLVHQSGHPIKGVIWYQGESDAGRGRDAYLGDLRNLVANFRADLASPELFFGNCQLATYQFTDIEQWVQIQDAQRVQGLDPLSAAVAIMDQPLADVIHLNVEGYKTAGARLARAVLHEGYGIPQVLGPQLVSVTIEPGGTTIRILYDKDVTGGIRQLYRVVDDGTPIQITSLTVSGPAVTLQMPGSLNGDIRVSYGYGRTPGVNWVKAVDGGGPALAFWSVPAN